MGRHYLVFGGTRETGLEVARHLTARGDSVTGQVRPASNAGDLEATGASIVRGDALNPDDVRTAFAAGQFDGVVCSLGAHRGDAHRPDFDGARNVIDVALEAGVKRHVLITAIGTADSRAAVSPTVIQFLGPVLELKEQAEKYLTDSGLDYTILRPGGMTSDPESGTGVLIDDNTVMGVINRADLGRLVVECLDDDATIGRIYSTVDPAIDWEPPLQRGDTSHLKTGQGRPES